MSNQPDHSNRGHAEFSPSSLKYVAACAGYQSKGGSSAASEMGTRIHEALEVHDPSALHNEEEVAIYEQIVEMENQFMSNFGSVAEEYNEIQVTVQLDGTETWGTCDRFLILANGNAVMADYKTGISIIDSPDKNWQAKAYVAGAFQKFPQVDKITFVFYVPKHNSSLHHTFVRDDLDSLVQELSTVVKAGESIRPKWESGTMQIEDCTPTQYCRFCKHEDHCPALGGLVINVAKKLDSTIVDIDPNDLSNPARLSELFRIAKIVENWSTRVKERTLEAAKEGVQLDGLKLRSMGKTRTITDNSTLFKITEEFGINPESVLEVASIPLGKLTKVVADQAPAEHRKEIQQNFVDACENAGIVRTSDERFTIASQ